MSGTNGRTTTDTHAKEGYKTAALEVARFGIGKLRPDLLEGSHLGSRNRLGAPGGLEDIREVLDDHTCVQRQYEVSVMEKY